MQLPEELCPWLKQRRIVVASDLVDTLAAKLKAEAGDLRVLVAVPGSALEGCAYRHPLVDRESPVVIGGDYITTEAGTGLVHTAPGHGQEDYAVGQRHGLPLLSPVDDAGVFTSEAGEFEGLAVQGEGNVAVVEALKAAGVLLRAEDYKHKYPYDWRTKKPTIFRATDQWFASVEAFKEAALAAIGTVAWKPAKGQNRITAMVTGRCGSGAGEGPWRARFLACCSTGWLDRQVLQCPGRWCAGLTGASRVSARGACRSRYSTTLTQTSR